MRRWCRHGIPPGSSVTEGYSILSESAVESRFALGNGFLGARAARSISRGPTWVSWLGYIKWQAAVLGFAGLDLRGDAISLAPRLPPEWACMSFAVRWRGRSVQIRIADGMVRVAVSDGAPVSIRVAGAAYSVQEGAALDVHCGTRAAVRR